ncbi:MAG: class I SAM-dependent methyltransferase, partial [Mycobacteriaceae bacterium]
MSKTRWSRERTAVDSQAYVQHFRQLHQQGVDTDGEARMVDALLGRGAIVLDAGCGTGRVGAALLARGHRVTAVDADPILLEEARRQDGLEVIEADLAELNLAGRQFDLIVAAGNVLVFLEPGTEAVVVQKFFEHT